MSQTITVAQRARLSESTVWQILRDYYHQKSISAWSEQLPLYITSNPFIANVYAHIIVRFIQDWLRLHPQQRQQPFYILELGAGAGQFSFYVLRALAELRQQLSLDDLHITYVMSDMTSNNLQYWQQHSQLKPFTDNGMLDFAVFDFITGDSIELLRAKTTLKAGAITTPLIVISNYVFDSVPSDVFTIKEKTIHEALITVSTKPDNLEDNFPKDWRKMRCDYQLNKINTPYYKDPSLDNILFNYADVIKDSTFLFPIESLRGIKRLQQFSQHMLMISSDKGFSELNELENLDYPEFDSHGIFSMMVNYHAIAEYFLKNNGDVFIQSPRDHIGTHVFTHGFSLNGLTETRLCLQQHVQGFSPSDFFNCYDRLSDVVDNSPLDWLLANLRLSHCDPAVLYEMTDRIQLLLQKEQDTCLLESLPTLLNKTADNFYYFPKTQDVLFNIGILFLELETYQDAIHYFKQSEQYFGHAYANQFNLGLCSYHTDDYPAALTYFEQASKLDPSCRETKVLIKQLKEVLST